MTMTAKEWVEKLREKEVLFVELASNEHMGFQYPNEYGQIADAIDALTAENESLKSQLAAIPNTHVTNLVYKDLQADYAKLQEKLERADTVLRKVEYGDQGNAEDGQFCPICGCVSPDHKIECELAALLRELREALPELERLIKQEQPQ